MFGKAVLEHPRFVIPALHTVQLVVQIWEEESLAVHFAVGTVLTMLWCARKVDRPRKRRVTVLTFLQTSRSAKVLVAALLCCPVDLVLLRWVHFTLAVPSGRVWEPGTIPAGTTSSERVGVDRFRAGRVALLVIVKTDADGTVALARPRIEYAPATEDIKTFSQGTDCT